MFLRNPERQEDDMGREGRDYWEAQLSEHWDSGLTIQEYSEQKHPPLDPSVAKGTPGWCERLGIAGAGRG